MPECAGCERTPCDCGEPIWATRYHTHEGGSFLNNISGGLVCLYTRAEALQIAAERLPGFLYSKATVERGWIGMREACVMERVILDLLPFADERARAGDPVARTVVADTHDFLRSHGWGSGLTPPKGWKP